MPYNPLPHTDLMTATPHSGIALLRSPQTYFRSLATILAISFIVKLALAWITKDTLSYFDEWGYYESARLILDKAGSNEIFRPPGYVCFLAAIFWMFGDSLFWAKAAQVIISTLSVVVVYEIGRQVFNGRVAIVAAGIFAFFPDFVAYSHYLWSETLFIFFILAFFYVLFLTSRAHSPRKCFFTGVTFASVALTRTAVFPLSLIAITYFFFTTKSARNFLTCTLSFLLGAALLIAPWTTRNYMITHRFCLIATESTGYVWSSLNTMIHYANDYRVYELFRERGFYEEGDQIFPGVKGGRAINRPASSKPNPVDAYREEMANAWTFALNNPGLVLKRIWPKFCILWGPNSFLIRHMRLGIYGRNFAEGKWPIRIYPPPDLKLVQAITLVSTLSYAVVMITGCMGLIFHRPSKESSMCILYILMYTAVTSIMQGMSRYRLPMMPFIIIFSAYGICHAREIFRAPDKKVRWVLFVLLCDVFLILCALHVGILFDIF